MTAQALSIIASFVISVFPSVILRYIPYGDRLRAKKWKIVALHAVLLALEVFIYLWVMQSQVWSFQQLQTFKGLYSMLYVALPFLLIRENFFKLAFIWVITSSYIIIALRLATFIELRYFGGSAVHELDFTLNNIILLAIILVTWVPVVFFLQRAIMPALDAADNSVARFIWVVPGFFLLLYFIYVTDLRPEQLSNGRYIMLIIPLVGGIGISCYTLVRLLRQAAQRARLDAEVSAMNRQLALQRKQYGRIIRDEEAVRAARHDLHHQLAVLGGYLAAGDPGGAARYCEALMGSIPPASGQSWCQNFAVNAIAAHYLTIAGEEGVRTETGLDIPEDTGAVPATDLCIVVGNLLENALEACGRLPEGERFLRLHSRVQHGRLYITLDNSYDGQVKQRGRAFLSRKHEGVGVGLTSVQAVCEKFGGTATFEAGESVFQSSVILQMAAEA